MNALAPCPSCHRHIRVAEAACPFCGNAVTLEEVVPRGIYAQRLGRAALFTFGAAALTTAGCGTSTTPGDAGTDAAMGLDGAADVADVGHDAYYGSIGDVYGTPDVSFLYDAGTDAAVADDANEPDAGVHAPYGAPPPPPEPEVP
jgi:hypothetical protein